MADSVANIKNAMPSVEYHGIEGGGHLVHYENPSPVNKILVSFLKK
jgi:pimeloyl-ACP methyl ester carboxylesterase